ncbi:MAG: hypothetical protein QM766_04510 [Burkholderiaceae bacterium]
MPRSSDTTVTRQADASDENLGASRHGGQPASSAIDAAHDGPARTSLDEALDDTFPASDPVAATAGAGGEIDTDPSPDTADAMSVEGRDAASGRRATANGRARIRRTGNEPVPFPTSRRAGAGVGDDRQAMSLRPDAVQMLQADHAHLLLTTQKFKPRLSFDRKRAIVDTVCITLEVHTQIKEEIFLPALSDVMPADDPDLAAAVGAIEPLRDEIARLRGLRPWDDAFDGQFMSMMNAVLHGIAEEETRLLPIAQSRLADRLDALGAQMSHRRMQLMGPHLAALTINTLRTLPFGGWLAGAGAFAGGLLLARTLAARRP